MGTFGQCVNIRVIRKSYTNVIEIAGLDYSRKRCRVGRCPAMQHHPIKISIQIPPFWFLAWQIFTLRVACSSTENFFSFILFVMQMLQYLLHSPVPNLKLAICIHRVEKTSLHWMPKSRANLTMQACSVFLEAVAQNSTGISYCFNQSCGGGCILNSVRRFS